VLTGCNSACSRSYTLTKITNTRQVWLSPQNSCWLSFFHWPQHTHYTGIDITQSSW